MWEYRELVRNLTIADLKNRYQNTTLGFFWSLLSPLLFALVLYIVFRKVFEQEQNFALNLIVGIMVFRYFSLGTSTCLSSVVSRPNLVTKVFIPRHILVLSTALSNLVASLLEFIILIPVIYFSIHQLPVTILIYPLLHLITFFIIMGIGLLLGSLFVYFRDLTQIWEFVLNVLFYTSPIVYPLTIVPPYLREYYMINPLTRVVIMYRDILIGNKIPSLVDFGILMGFAVVFVLLGYYVFTRLQRRFAEEL